MWPTDLLPLTFAELKKIRNFFTEVQILGLSGTTGRRVGSATPTAGWGPCRGHAGPLLVSPRPASPPGPLGVWLPLLASTPRPSALGEKAPGLGPVQRRALGRGPHRVAQRCGLHLSGNPQLSTALRAGTVHTLSSGAHSPLSSKRCPVQEGAALGSCGLAALPLSTGPLGRRGERGAVGEDRVRSRLPRVRRPVPPPGLCLVHVATSLNATPPHTFPRDTDGSATTLVSPGAGGRRVPCMEQRGPLRALPRSQCFPAPSLRTGPRRLVENRGAASQDTAGTGVPRAFLPSWQE